MFVVTTSSDLVMSLEDAVGTPVRISADDVKVVVGASVAARGPSWPALAELTLVSSDQPSLAFLVDSAAAPSLTRRAESSS